MARSVFTMALPSAGMTMSWALHGASGAGKGCNGRGTHQKRSYPAAAADPRTGRIACSDSRMTRRAGSGPAIRVRFLADPERDPTAAPHASEAPAAAPAPDAEAANICSDSVRITSARNARDSDCDIFVRLGKISNLGNPL